MSDPRQIFTLQQVVSSIRKTIEERYQQAYWVKAEMHKLNLYPSGHAFPELVQKENDKIVAQINGSIWNHNVQRINKQFMQVVKEPLKEGTMLLMQVKIAFSETYGLSLQILDIDPNYTLGELQREREETLKKLQAERILNANQQLAFPLLPQRIAVISADTSKGLSDFMKVLDNNPWGYAFFTMLFPAYLQGDMAVQSIIEQLKRIEKVKHHFDSVVIVRGGGGEVGMSCYNNYNLCKAIASFELPVLTGIGHSTNLTVAEMVAFRNAITPTELADFLLQTFHDFSVPVEEARKALRTYSDRLIDTRKQLFAAEVRHFRSAAQLYLSASGNLLFNTSQRFKNEAKTLIIRHREAIGAAQKNTMRLSQSNLYKEHERMERFLANLKQTITSSSERNKRELENLEKMVDLLDPKNVLKRGYSITTYHGRTVDGTTVFGENPRLKIETYDLLIEAEMIQKIPQKKTEN
ncbi:MAG: exodeoxyribonuclease VII large subunit [Flavobacteriales bacterium]|jgi:exodeoxyribonuclease VII large subunit